jgi:gas vesicle protein
VIGGVVPFAGGLLSAAAGAWSENEQERVNKFFKHWIKMLEDEIKEKERTILEIMARLDIHDEEIAKRLESKEYQSLLKKTFREWSGAESEDKRTYIRNILANAAASNMTSDEVVRL